MLRRQLFIQLALVSLVLSGVFFVVDPAVVLPLQAGQLFAPNPQATFDCTAVVTIPQSECEALVAFYNATDGAGWRVKTNWFLTNNPCQWEGVRECLNGHVTNLGFADNRLAGEIPASIGAFTHLHTLNLFQNRLTGTIPSAVSTLTALIQLRVDDNLLSGSIPTHLANLRNLEVLNLQGNNFSGSIPAEIGTMTSLRSLVLHRNALDGTLPATLTNLTNLYRLYLHQNFLSGSLPATLGNMSSLRELLLDNNQFSGELPSALVTLQAALDPTKTGFSYNRFISTNSAVRTAMQTIDPDWETTQTVPPTNLQGTPASSTSIQLDWTKIPYEGDGGYYEISVAVSGGNYTVRGETQNKSTDRYLLTGLQPATTYQIRLRTFTPAHGDQKNSLFSDYTPAILVMPGPIPTVTPTPQPTVTFTPPATDTPTPRPTVTFTRQATDTLTPTAPATVTPTFTSQSPTPTPTVTATDVGGTQTTLTPTSTATDVLPSCGEPSSSALNCRSYLPIVALPPTPTFTPTFTPPSPLPPAWRQLTGGLNSAALAVQGNTLFAGVIGNSGAARGLYTGSLANCPANVNLTQVSTVNRPGGESVYGIIFAGNNGVVASYDGGVYYSADAGNFWQKPTTSLLRPRTVTNVRDTFFVGTQENGIYQSKDGGRNWSQEAGIDFPNDINAVVADTIDSAKLWIGAEDTGVWAYTVDLNRQPSNPIQGLADSARDVWDIVFDPANNIYLATGGGVYRGNGVTTWTLYGASPTGTRSLALINDTLYVGVSNNGVWRRPLSGGDWERVTSPGWNDNSTVRDLLYDPTHCGGLLAATNDGVWLYPLP